MIMQIIIIIKSQKITLIWVKNIFNLLNLFQSQLQFKVSLANRDQRTIGPENAHLKPDLGVLSHNEMTLTLNTHTPLLNS